MAIMMVATIIVLPSAAGAGDVAPDSGGLATPGLGAAASETAGCENDLFSYTADDGQVLCTHGPDQAPSGMEVQGQTVSAYSATAASSFACITDGDSGKRVQLLYARSTDKADTFAYWQTQAPGFASSIDNIYSTSAAQTGGDRRVRFRTNSDCSLNMQEVLLSPAGDDSFWAMVDEVKAQGFTDPETKYLIFVEANVYCGLGVIYGDDQPGPNNANNRYAGYSRIDRGCWSATVAAHELTHNLGGVQQSAPNSTTNSHCTDEWDLMCYSDGSGQALTYPCGNAASNAELDCGKDDYFNTNPAAGSYLANNWNVANSPWLEAGVSSQVPGAPQNVKVAALPNATVCTGASCNVTVSWSQGTGSTDTYLVQGSNGFSASTTGYSITAPGLAAGSSVSFTVTPSNGTGSGSATTSATYAVPGAITGWAVGSQGQVFPLGNTPNLGGAAEVSNSSVVAGVATASGNGYWLAEANGRIAAYGDAVHYGDMLGQPLQGAIVAMAATQSGNGYWLLGTDGGIFSFGDAQFYGSMGGIALNSPILDMTPTAKGYWLVGGDGGVFSFGDASFYGSMGGQVLNSPVRSITAAKNGSGYWLIGGDGGIFAFDAPFHGSLPGVDASLQGVRIRAAEDGSRYWILTPDGKVYQFRNGGLDAIFDLGLSPAELAVDLFLG